MTPEPFPSLVAVVSRKRRRNKPRSARKPGPCLVCGAALPVGSRRGGRTFKVCPSDECRRKHSAQLASERSQREFEARLQPLHEALARLIRAAAG